MTSFSEYPRSRNRFLLNGVFTILAVVALGAGLGYALGFDVPMHGFAQTIYVTAPPPLPPPIQLPPPPVIVPTLAPLIPTIVVTGTRNDNDKQSEPDVDIEVSNCCDSDNQEIIVTGDRDEDIEVSPCCAPELPDVDIEVSPCCDVTPPPPFVPFTPPPIVVTPPIVVPPPPPSTTPGECLFLTASPQVITAPGQAVTLTWSTRNVDSITIDNGVGRVTPTAGGSVTVRPTGNTTYIATVTGGAQSPNCRASVRLETTTTEQPRCIDLSANKTLIERGEEVILTWRTQNASSISINQGIGQVTPVAAGSITVRPREETTYVATVPNAPQNPDCEAVVRIRSGGGGGGGGGSRSRPRVFLDSVTRPAEAPLASVYLSEIPYTGLDLGPVGTVFYWLTLILWSMAAAYLVLFTFVPYVFRRTAAAQGSHESGDLPGWGSMAPTGPPVNFAAAPAPATVHRAAHAAAVATAIPARPVAAVPASSERVYSPHEGFRSFGEGGTLTIDDIVKGLSRESGMEFERESEPAPTPASAREAQPATRTAKASLPAPEYADDIVGFIESLLEGDRDRVFGTIRTITKQDGDTAHFLSQAVCALDDAYRARVEGTHVHPEIERVTRDCHHSFLERIVSSLATAVDSSYSAGVTGTKLALTRALAIVNG